jgi:uncharacterized repeat protein (TIGR01451 family)
LNLSDLTLTGNTTAGGTITNVPTVNDTPLSGSTGATDTITSTTIQRNSDQALTYSGVTNLTVSGSNGSDTFNVTPSTSTLITIHGNNPTPQGPAPGDTLNVDLTGLTNPTLTDTFDPATGYSGTWKFGNAVQVAFDTIENLTPAADLAVMQTATGNPATPGDITFTITVTNHGGSAATNVILTDMVPAGTTFVSSSFSGYNPTTGMATLGTLANGASVMGTITVMPKGVETISNTATVKSDLRDPNPANNTSTLVVFPSVGGAVNAVSTVGPTLFAFAVGSSRNAQLAITLVDPFVQPHFGFIFWGDGTFQVVSLGGGPGGFFPVKHRYSKHARHVTINLFAFDPSPQAFSNIVTIHYTIGGTT